MLWDIMQLLNVLMSENVQWSYTEDNHSRRRSVSQRGFLVGSPLSLSSTETTKPERTGSVFSWRQSSTLNFITPRRPISLPSSHVQGFTMHWSLMMCYQVFDCMHLLLCPYGSKLAFQGIDWPESNVFRCLDYKNISSLWIPFGFKVTENVMFLKKLAHTEIICTASLQVCTSDFTTDFTFETAKANQQRNLLCFQRYRIYFSVQIKYPDLVANHLSQTRHAYFEMIKKCFGATVLRLSTLEFRRQNVETHNSATSAPRNPGVKPLWSTLTYDSLAVLWAARQVYHR